MSREFITAALSRAVHEEIFRLLLKNDAEAAADAMELTYTPDDLRQLEAIRQEILDLDADHSREFLQGLLEQPQDVFGSPQRKE